MWEIILYIAGGFLIIKICDNLSATDERWFLLILSIIFVGFVLLR